MATREFREWETVIRVRGKHTEFRRASLHSVQIWSEMALEATWLLIPGASKLPRLLSQTL